MIADKRAAKNKPQLSRAEAEWMRRREQTQMAEIMDMRREERERSADADGLTLEGTVLYCTVGCLDTHPPPPPDHRSARVVLCVLFVLSQSASSWRRLSASSASTSCA